MDGHIYKYCVPEKIVPKLVSKLLLLEMLGSTFNVEGHDLEERTLAAFTCSVLICSYF